MKKGLRYVYFIAVILLSMRVNAAEGDFDTLLRQLEVAENVNYANKLFKLLFNGEFTNTLVHYNAQTPMDTVRAEV